MASYNYSKVSLVLSCMYLLARLSLQEKKEGTSWEDLCRHYRTTLSKTNNLIFCDGVGINQIFGDFLSLLDMNMANIIECTQVVSGSLLP